MIGNLRSIARRVRHRELIPLFDTGYYLSQRPDITAKRLDPLTHFVLYGHLEGVKPHPLFDPLYYRRQVPDLARDDSNLLVHFIRGGWRRGYDPHPLFSSSFYIERNPDVAAAGVNPLVHYVRYGSAEGRWPHPLFDTGYYLSQRPDITAKRLDPLTHFVLYGHLEGVKPHPLFDPLYYRRQVPELARDDSNPLVHFIQGGWRRGYDPHPLFSSSFYIERNPDVAAAGVNPLVHYVCYGSAEGRWPNEWFCPKEYGGVLNGTGPLEHFVTVGLREGQAPTRQGELGGIFHRLMCSTLRAGDAARAISQDRFLMHLDRMDDVLSVAGTIRPLVSAASAVIRLRPADRHVLPAVRVLDGPGWPAAPTTLPEKEVARLENVIAIGGARLVVTADGELLHDELSAPEGEYYGSKLPYVRAHAGSQALAHVELDKSSIEEGVLLASDSDFNYFHWMLESLPKVELLEAANIPLQVPLLVSQRVPLTGLEALYRVAGERPIMLLRDATGYRVGHLHVPSDRSRVLNNYGGIGSMQNDIVIDPGAIDFLRTRLLCSQPSVPSKKIFLAREARGRRLLNEPHLIESLSELGFEVADPGTMGLKEQIALLSDAAVVIAPTGAALTNIVFAHPAARLLILAPNHPQTNPYLFTQIGSHLGLDVAFAFGDRSPSLTNRYGIHDDYFADIKSVLAWAMEGQAIR